jgi:hypothetical protein
MKVVAAGSGWWPEPAATEEMLMHPAHGREPNQAAGRISRGVVRSALLPATE